MRMTKMHGIQEAGDRSRGRLRRRTACCAVSGLACALLAPLAQAQAATTQTFNPTGAEQTFTVPPGVTAVNILAIGEAGGKGEIGAGAPGLPAEVRGEVSVTPGETLYVEVAKGAFNGGGVQGGLPNNGGGTSDVRTSPRAAGLSPDTRFIVAGGGGGGGEVAGGPGAPGAGGNAGEAGKNAEGVNGANGGGAGTLTQGGAGGVGEAGAVHGGAAGTLGSGGSGGGGTPSVGGGGGGGYYGGGGGGAGGEVGFGSGGAGGGGGSSLVPAGGSMTLASSGTKAAVQISYTAGPGGPRWFMSGKLITSKHQPGLSFGRIELHNGALGNLECTTFISDQIWNQVREGTERGVEETYGYGTSTCASAFPCEVTNERGVKKEGNFISAEGPPDMASGKARRNGNTSLPWLGELTEKEPSAGVHEKYILTRHVKLWYVVPLGTEMGGTGVGPGCSAFGGHEIAFEDGEGASEKARGGELEPEYGNGAKNGMSPSHIKFEGEKAETSGARETGQLESEVGAVIFKGSLLSTGATAFELIQAK